MFPTRASFRVLSGFGGAARSVCHVAEPGSVDELRETLVRARREGWSVAFRGSGKSYGDANLNAHGLVVDTTRLDQMIRWEPAHGVFEAGGGMTIEGVWRRTIEDGYWPAIVPGTMKPTLGGCIGMNIHGKNNFVQGTFGEHVLELDLVTVDGQLIRCSKTENADVFRAVVGGMGLLGAVTRVKLKLKHVGGGRLRVTSLRGGSLDELFRIFTEWLPGSDYLVGWVDCMSSGSAIGRGVLHSAIYQGPADDPLALETLHVERQGLPPDIFGVPNRHIWRILGLFFNDPGLRLLNEAKYQAAWFKDRTAYLQSHAAFAFLLDYVPNWQMGYGPHGLIQYQIFAPKETALECFKRVLSLSQREGVHSYLGVLKRHRPDEFVLSHGVDGWSLALDFPVMPHGRERLWRVTEKFTEIVLQCGGRFYFAKDAVLRAADVTQAYGHERLDTFRRLKAKLDPEGVLQTDLSRRLLTSS